MSISSGFRNLHEFILPVPFARYLKVSRLISIVSSKLLGQYHDSNVSLLTATLLLSLLRRCVKLNRVHRKNRSHRIEGHQLSRHKQDRDVLHEALWKDERDSKRRAESEKQIRFTLPAAELSSDSLLSPRESGAAVRFVKRLCKIF